MFPVTVVEREIEEVEYMQILCLPPTDCLLFLLLYFLVILPDSRVRSQNCGHSPLLHAQNIVQPSPMHPEPSDKSHQVKVFIKLIPRQLD